MKKRILALCLSVALLFTTALISALAAPKAPKIKSITVGKNYKSATVKWSKVKSAKKYQIKYGYKKSLKGAKTKTVAKTKVTLKKLKAGKTLYVKVRAKYKSGKKFKHTKFSAVKSVKLAKAVVPTTIAPTTAIIPTTVSPTTTTTTTTTVTTTTTTEAPTTVPTTTAPELPITEPITYNMTQLADSTRLIGRGEYIEDTLVCDWTASGFECGIKFQGDLTINFESIHKGGFAGKIGVIIDEDYDNMQVIRPDRNTTSATIETDVEYKYHKVRIIKLNDAGYSNPISFKSLTFAGKPEEKPADKALKIEVYGDSITCGEGNYPNSTLDSAYRYEDGSYTYASIAARKLNADLSTVAIPGWGLLYNFRGNTDYALPSVWDKSLPQSDSSKTWDFTKYQADLVIINLGTNDSTALNNVKDAESVQQTTEDSVKQAALDFCNNIRQKYPNCTIVWVEGMMLPYNSTFSNGIKAALNSLDNAYHCSLPRGSNGIGGHPNAEEHKTCGELLYDFLIENGIVE